MVFLKLKCLKELPSWALKTTWQSWSLPKHSFVESGLQLVENWLEENSFQAQNSVKCDSVCNANLRTISIGICSTYRTISAEVGVIAGIPPIKLQIKESKGRYDGIDKNVARKILKNGKKWEYGTYVRWIFHLNQNSMFGWTEHLEKLDTSSYSSYAPDEEKVKI
ncbi:unnamed protein product [Brassicogethes aeneus]|uniref:Uncharacterized protein n=1 Tax=Brassicogethes aeneus TaxID=1431903 RepID=A0A9P0B909_BRAAE|nr:unnamed protein product [Brassicogethes aeneus]